MNTDRRRESDEIDPPKPFDQKKLEMAVVAWIVAYPARFYEVAELREEHFLVPACRKVFRVIRTLLDERGADAATSMALITKKLADAGMKEEDSFAILTEAADYLPGGSAAVTAIRDELATAALKRALETAGADLTGLSKTTGTSDQLVASATEVVNVALRQAQGTKVVSLAEEIQAEFQRMERGEGQVMGMSTGLRDLDDLTSGLHGGEFWVIAARPGMGKTSLLYELMLSLAGKQLVPGVMFSLEMRRRECTQRIACNVARLNIQKVRLGALNQEERAAYVKALKQLEPAPIFIEDKGAITFPRLRATAQRLYYEEGIGWLAVDYLQLMDHMQQRGDTRSDAITRTSNGLKALAQSLNIPVIALAQCNRECEKRDDKRPRLWDLKESGAIEQDADIVAFLYRDAMYYKPEQIEQCRNATHETAEIIIAKQRNGPLGTVKATWVRRCGAFEDYGGGGGDGDMEIPFA